MTTTLTFIGGGNLATALIGGLHATRRDLTVRVVDRNPSKRATLAREYGADTRATLDREIVQADLIVLAVKPGDVAAVSRELGELLSQQVVVSVAAGIRTATLSSWLGGYSRVVWAMPNTPAFVGKALTGLYATRTVSSAERALVQGVFEAVGAAHWLADESQMDALTAISGCGPAYVCMLVEALESAARRLGFDAAAATKLSLHTLHGASQLLERSGETPTRLREKITTPRGVTEQAIASLRESDLEGMMVRATAAAHAKSQAIGNQYNGARQLQAGERIGTGVSRGISER